MTFTPFIMGCKRDLGLAKQLLEVMAGKKLQGNNLHYVVKPIVYVEAPDFQATVDCIGHLADVFIRPVGFSPWGWVSAMTYIWCLKDIVRRGFIPNADDYLWKLDCDSLVLNGDVLSKLDNADIAGLQHADPHPIGQFQMFGHFSGYCMFLRRKTLDILTSRTADEWQTVFDELTAANVSHYEDTTVSYTAKKYGCVGLDVTKRLSAPCVYEVLEAGDSGGASVVHLGHKHLFYGGDPDTVKLDWWVHKFCTEAQELIAAGKAAW